MIIHLNNFYNHGFGTEFSKLTYQVSGREARPVIDILTLFYIVDEMIDADVDIIISMMLISPH